MEDFSTIASLMSKYGLIAVLLAYFVYKDWVRSATVYELIGSLTEYLKSKRDAEEEFSKIKAKTEDNAFRISTLERKGNSIL